MRYYLLDASAFIYAMEKLGQTKRDFFVEKASGTAFLYMPQFCVTEILNTFARFFYRQKKIGEALYNKWRTHFIEAIRNRKMLYCYDLHRYHNLNADRVYEIEHKESYGPAENRLSAFDILVIAMGAELKRIHSPNEVYVLTRDRRLRTISNMNKEFAQAIWFR